MKRISWLMIVPLVLGAVAAPLACVENRNYVLDPNAGSSSSSTSSSGGGAGGDGGMMSTSSTSSGTGGMGGTPECVTVTDCPKYECKNATGCNAGSCVWQNDAMGANVLPQLKGDCKIAVCDGNGGITFVDDPGDVYDWMNPCLLKTCDPSKPAELDPNVTKCTTAWGAMMGTCDPMLKTCIECSANDECLSNVCHVPSGRCYPATCGDLAKNGMETDIDCGGMECPACVDGLACIKNADCMGSCDMGTMKCIAATCTDTARNGDETDVDCGGSCADKDSKKCSSGQKCRVPADCQSGVCIASICGEPDCFDGTQNQGEAGIDCGGPCPVLCP